MTAGPADLRARLVCIDTEIDIEIDTEIEIEEEDLQKGNKNDI